MADIFCRDNFKSLIDGKYMLIFGGSNMRALYKDVLVLINSDRLTFNGELKKKLEPSFLGDSLLHSVGMTRGRNFKEHRLFKIDETRIEYFFITKCLCPDVSNTLNEILVGERPTPDVVAMNSTLWDITRWGSQSVQLFKDNLRKLIDEFKRCLPPSTLVIWLTTPPLSIVHGGVLIPEVEFLKHTMRFDAMEANIFAHDLMTVHGFDVLDFHHYLKLNVHRRIYDGIHWQPKAVRYMTNLLLTHISLAWDRTLPRNEGLEETQLKTLLENIDELMPPTEGIDQERSNLIPANIESKKSNILNKPNPKTPVFGEGIKRPDQEISSGFFRKKIFGERKDNYLLPNTRRSQGKIAVYRGSAARRSHRAGPYGPSAASRNNLNNYQSFDENEYQFTDGCYFMDNHNRSLAVSSGMRNTEEMYYNNNPYYNNCHSRRHSVSSDFSNSTDENYYNNNHNWGFCMPGFFNTGERYYCDNNNPTREQSRGRLRRPGNRFRDVARGTGNSRCRPLQSSRRPQRKPF